MVAPVTSVLEASAARKRSAWGGAARPADLTVADDVVILGMDGCMLAAHLRERRPGSKLSSVPVTRGKRCYGSRQRPGKRWVPAQAYDAAALVHTHGLLAKHLPMISPTRLAV